MILRRSKLLSLNKGRYGTLLNGSSQYWSNGSPANFALGGSQMLMMAWVKSNVTTGVQGIVGKYKSAAAGRSMYLVVETGTPILYVSADGNGNANQLASANIVPGRWTMYAGTYSPSALNLYTNGSLSNGGLTGSIPASLFDPVGTPLTVGVNGTLASGFFNGTIGPVQVVKFTTLPADIASIIAQAYATRKMPTAYSGGTIIFETDWKQGGYDKSGNGNTVTATGGASIIKI